MFSFNMVFRCLLLMYVSLALIVSAKQLKNLYPINTYKMFSKYWSSDIKMSSVWIKTNKGQMIAVKDVLTRLPFFQVNDIFTRAFWGQANLQPNLNASLQLQSTLCQIVLEKMQQSRIQIVGRVYKYSRTEKGEISQSLVSEEVAKTCSI